MDYDVIVREFKGIPVSAGIAIERAFLFSEISHETPHYEISETEVVTEISRYKEAIDRAEKEMLKLKDNILDSNSEQFKLLHAHHLMLKDPMFNSKVFTSMEDSLKNVEWVLEDVVNEIIEMFNASQDNYLKERIADVHDVSRRIMVQLMYRETISLADLIAQVVLVAPNLLPSDVMQMKKRCVSGIVMDSGGKTSHTAILARSFGIPAVLGLQVASHEIENGAVVIVDGTRGLVITEPDEDTLSRYEVELQEYQKQESLLFNLSNLPAETTDAKLIRLKANIEFPEEIDSVRAYNAEGIGLYRSEFLFMDPTVQPDEELQYKAYSEVLSLMEGRPVTIRTLDVGGDKLINEVTLEDEKNPLLGWRAIRFCLGKEAIFLTQLRAMLRASVHGNLRIMFPMISGIEELELAMKMLKKAKLQLIEKHIEFDENIQVGIMIEVPSAALSSDILARKVDFFSIGTNDLIQYTMAIDRGNEKVAHMYQPFHPAILRLIKMVVDNAHAHGIPVSMCGEMAGESLFTVPLIGMGLDELSMSAYSLPGIKKIIRKVSILEAEELLGTILEMRSYHDIDQYVRIWMEEKFE